MKKSSYNELWFALAIALTLASLRLLGFRPVEILELRALDYRLLQRDRSEHSSDVVIVAIDAASLEIYGRWPWPRARMAELIDGIAAAKPAVIGVDAVWSESTTECDAGVLGPGVSDACRSQLDEALSSGRGDQRLAEAVRNSGNTVLGYFFDFDRKVRAPEKPEDRARERPTWLDAARNLGRTFLGFFLDVGEEPPKAEEKISERTAGAAENGSKWAGEGAYSIVRSEEGGRGEQQLPSAEGAPITRSLPVISEAGRARGYFNVNPDIDGLRRRVPLVVSFDGRMVTPLSLTMLAVRWPEKALSIDIGPFGVTSVRLGGMSIPAAENGDLLVNYRGRRKTFTTISAAAVLQGEVPPEDLRGKLVLLGVTAAAAGDIVAAPLDSMFPGVEIHANILDNILRQDFVFQSPRGGLTTGSVVDTLILLIGCLALALALRRMRGVRAALVYAFALAAYLGMSQLLFVETGIALRVVYPALALALVYFTVSVQHYLAAERETRETRRVLDLYLSPSVSREISAHPEMLNLGGEKRERTVLFSDVRSFTSISEKLDPEELVELLNLYLGEMTDMVFTHNGMLDKYIGDGLMAVWGAPLPQSDHAVLSCRAALGMVEKLRTVNEHGASRGWPPLEIRIGINSGQMVFGNMGSAQHLSLTVMGDNVNLAARLEGINKLYGSTIIAAEATVSAAGGEFLWRELDWVQVKGKTQRVQIFELLEGGQLGRESLGDALDNFQAGLAAFRAQRWDQASRCFESALKARPKDGPAGLYLRRSQQFERQPPADGWEAVTVFSE